MVEKLKIHRLVPGSELHWTMCGIYVEENDRIHRTWRGVTCKSCLRAKP